MVVPHLDIGHWLQASNLSIYITCFQDYKGVEDLLHLKEIDIKALGVRNGAHRATIVSSLVMLREKYQKFGDDCGSKYSVSPERKILTVSCSPSGLEKNTSQSYMEPVVNTETSPEDLKKALEWELKLDNRDLRSHAWYHGTIPRARAEELVTENGDFLIRDCISHPGDFVLTCSNSKSSLHFVINKVVLQPHTVYERIQYQFEDDSFDTIPDLVTYYVGNKRPISAASGAVISRPVNRSMPLSYYASKYGLEQQKVHVHGSVVGSAAFSPKSSPRHTPKNSPTVSKKLLFDGSHGAKSPTNKSQTYDNSSQYPGCLNRKMVRVGSDPMLSPSIERKPWEFRHSGTINSSEVLQQFQDHDNIEKPPPKPSRIPSVRTAKKPEVKIRRKNSMNNDPNANEGNKINSNESDILVSGTGPNLPDKQQRRNPMGRSSLLEYKRKGFTTSASLSNKIPVTIPKCDSSSVFNLDAFRPQLLPVDENKPLELSTLLHVKSMLLESGSRILSNHLTKVDLTVLKSNTDNDLGMGVTSGLELITLPHGKQLREDILQRAECMKLFVAVSILMCNGEVEQASMVNKWIQVADETKTAIGNLYGFHNVMSGLTLSQIGRLQSTWLCIRQQYTETAFTFETKLRPTIKAMQECNNPVAPNTCIPHVMPLAVLLDHEFIDEDVDKKTVPVMNVPWDESGIDYGLQLLFKHMDVGRQIVKDINTFRRNSRIVLDNVKFDEILLEMFKTEFQLRFLYGSRGARANSSDRYSKFQQVLNVMSQRCQPN